MVWHDNKLMQKIFLLPAVIEQDFNEEPGNFLQLEEAFSLEHIGGDKVGGFSCSSSIRNRQKVTSAASMRRLVIVKLFPSLTGFASAVHSSRCFYPHSDEPQWARCILVSDDDEWVLLSEARPRRAKPLVAVTETRDGNESGKVLTSVLLMLAYGLLFNS
jgi:hypothetical protein